MENTECDELDELDLYETEADDEIVWEDRKRHFGLPVSFTRYGLSRKRVFVKSGVFSVRQADIMHVRVRDIKASISLGQRLFGVGTVTIFSDDKRCPEMKLENIRNPLRVKELIRRYVEQFRAEFGLGPL